MSADPSLPPAIVDVRFGALLPWTFHVLAGVSLLVAVALVMKFPLLAAIIAVVAILILSAGEGTQIDFAQKRYREYTSFWFVRTGTWTPYDTIDALFVNANKMRQRIGTYQIITSEFMFTEYRLYLRINYDEKILLKKSKNRRALLRDATGIGKQLNMDVADYTA